MLSAWEHGELTQIEARLCARFVPPLQAEDVHGCLEEAAVRHQSARVRTYVLIFIERTATELLAAQSRRLPTLDDGSAAEEAGLRSGELLLAQQPLVP